MLSKYLLVLASLMSSSVFAASAEVSMSYRKAEVNKVKWNATEIGLSYLFDINEELAVGPYLSTSQWEVRNTRLHTHGKADDREFGPEFRFVIPLETVDFMAGASYSLLSQGTAKSAEGKTADIAVEGFRFKLGLAVPFDGGYSLFAMLVKGLQTVELKNEFGSAKENLDDLALTIGVNF